MVNGVTVFPINTRSARVPFSGGVVTIPSLSPKIEETRTELSKIDISHGGLIKGAAVVIQSKVCNPGIGSFESAWQVTYGLDSGH